MKVKHATISFELPGGFIDETTISITKPLPVDKNGRPVDNQAYPLSITINRDVVGKAPGPVPYLQHKLGQMRSELQEFQLQTIEADKIGGYSAAKAQFSFVAYFQLFQLVYVWFVGEALMTATLSTTEPGVDEGWRVLRAVADSIELD